MKGEIVPVSATSPDTREAGKSQDGALNSVPQSEVTLQGIVAGDRGVAILKVGGKEFVVNGGDKFAGNYTLVSVAQTQVVVRSGHKDQTLSVTAG